ncbi:MAG: bifunctional 5,10-methylenetetrahydrofolate dehydrogenase/5,10-methenyltetrahydrofolate cyclohydrolase [Anaerolineales bacterium]
MAERIDGRAIAQQVLAEVSQRAGRLADRLGQPPRLAVVVAQGDTASARYVRQIARTGERVGVAVAVHTLNADCAAEAPVALVAELSADRAVQGIIIQQPLPPRVSATTVLAVLDPHKDIDGLHPINAGLLAQGRPEALAPATPLGGIELLHRLALPIEGQHAVMVGRSTVVGRPLALLLLREHATVTICHTRTRDLPAMTRQADILAVAAGRAGLITAEMVRPGAIVLDFGANEVEGRMVGDVAAEVATVAGWLTPVPGGTGPMTVALLLQNLMTAAERQLH